MTLNGPCRLTDKQIEAFKVKKLINNEYICETAGFVPLEVKFKRFEQAGIRQQLNAADYTSSDYRDMYLNPDYQIYPDDEIEEVEAKFKALYNHIQEVKARASAKSNGKNEPPEAAMAGTEEPGAEVDPEAT